MKRLFTALLAVMIIPVFAYAAPIKVGISQIVEHPALDATRKGIIDKAAECGYAEGSDIDYDVQIAQGNVATANQIAKKFAGDNKDIVIGIATLNTQALKHVIEQSGKDIPLIFSAVTDPVGSKIADSIEKPGKNITGVSDLTPVKEQIALLTDIGIDVKKLGIIFNPGEQNSRALADLAQEAADDFGMELIAATAANSGAVYMAAKSLIGRVDAIYIPTDNTVVSALESVIQVANESDTPLVMGDTDSVDRGALGAKGFNYYKHGLQTGEVLCRILKGEEPGSIPVQFQSDLELFINLKAAKEMNVEVPQSVIDKADKVIK